MKYHPHGDASIGGALVVLANKELFIDKQGNFGNIFTGDEASAARYIECKVSSFAKDVFYNPKITEYAESYDGRNKEPVRLPAKLPVILLMGAEGIAVGMSTKILPHNPVEVIKAEIACLQGKKFEIWPDFPTGGTLDLADYQDGNGKVRVRAKLDTSDPKKIVITEVPFSSTTESLMASIEAAARSGQLKVASISDYTTDKVEIEIRLQRGAYTQDMVDALYAFTECEQSISCNCLVIDGDKPVVTTPVDIIRHHADRLLSILKRELEIERGELLDEIHARTLERIFIEERVYKLIETKKTQETVYLAVKDGLKPFDAEIGRPVTPEDIERLLKIPIRRISLWDIQKARDEMKRLAEALAEVERKLKDLVGYAVEVLKGMAKKLEAAWPRRTKIERFSKVEAKEVARRDVALRYDGQTGYIGTAVSSGDKVLEVSAFDRILVVRRNGMYSVVPVPEKLFVDQGLLWVAVANKDEIAGSMLTVVYKAHDTGFPYIKKTSIPSWIIGKDYSLIPEGAQLLLFSTEKDFEFTLTYAPKSRQKKTEETFRTKKFLEKGIKAAGVRLAPREVTGATSLAQRTSPSGLIEPELGLGADSRALEGGDPGDRTGSQDSQDLHDSQDASIGGLFEGVDEAPARKKRDAGKKASTPAAAPTAAPAAAKKEPAPAKKPPASVSKKAPAAPKRTPAEAKKALSESIKAKVAAKTDAAAKNAIKAADSSAPSAKAASARQTTPQSAQQTTPQPAPQPATEPEHKGLFAALARKKAELDTKEGEGGKDKK
jgi:topoisomerase-4 subunit A